MAITVATAIRAATQATGLRAAHVRMSARTLREAGLLPTSEHARNPEKIYPEFVADILLVALVGRPAAHAVEVASAYADLTSPGDGSSLRDRLGDLIEDGLSGGARFRSLSVDIDEPAASITWRENAGTIITVPFSDETRDFDRIRAHRTAILGRPAFDKLIASLRAGER